MSHNLEFYFSWSTLTVNVPKIFGFLVGNTIFVQNEYNTIVYQMVIIGNSADKVVVMSPVSSE